MGLPFSDIYIEQVRAQVLIFMNKEKESLVCTLLLFLLLPYLLTVLILGREACPASRELSTEEYVPAVTASQISWDYSKEAIKAQTVAARTNLYVHLGEKEEKSMIQKAVENIRKKEMNSIMLKKYRIFQEAARETEGQVLKYQDQLREIPYHALSAGRTRDGKEILGEDYGYIVSADTSKDIDSPLYVEGCYFSEKDLEEQIKKDYPGFKLGEEKKAEIQKTDSAGYVMEIEIGNLEFQGEQLKELLNLPSYCFTIQRLKGEIRFLCRGIGHGMGLSQYTAEQMALEGKKYEEILQYFFPEMVIEER